jgi:hypothetical protein
VAALPAKNLQGVGGTIFGSGGPEPSGRVFSANVFVDGRRFRELDRRQQYYDGTQHDAKRFDFDGRIIEAAPGIGYTQPMVTEKAMPNMVPLRSRRPSSPYRLARAIVNAFTAHLFGEGRFPNLKVDGDEDSDDWVKQCGKTGKLPLRMLRARNLGGSTGTVGLSWSFIDGRPKFRVHNAKHLFVHAWQDREDLVPEALTECFQFTEEQWDPDKKRVEEVRYWQRKDWDKSAETVFLPALAEPGKDPAWVVDREKSVTHNDNETHFVWAQNLPSDQIDGLPDYDMQYESLDELDVLLSVMTRGAKLNLDPTLVLKQDMLMFNQFGVKKGSDHALVVPFEGDAKYLELAGSSIEAGIKLFNEARRCVLEVAECVIPDPDQIAAQGQSAAAQKMVFSRMLSKGGVLQEQYGEALERLMEPLLFISQARVSVPAQVENDDGETEEVDQEFRLPPRIDQQDEIGDDGVPTGKQNPVVAERHPGEGENVEAEWPPRFPPTALDQQQTVTTMSTAVGGKPVISQQTAVEIVTEAFGRKGQDEWGRVQGDQSDEDARQAQMTPGAGGQVGAPGQMPPGAKPKPPGGGGKPPGGGGAKAGGGGGDGGDKPAEPPAD